MKHVRFVPTALARKWKRGEVMEQKKLIALTDDGIKQIRKMVRGKGGVPATKTQADAAIEWANETLASLDGETIDYGLLMNVLMGRMHIHIGGDEPHFSISKGATGGRELTIDDIVREIERRRDQSNKSLADAYTTNWATICEAKADALAGLLEWIAARSALAKAKGGDGE